MSVMANGDTVIVDSSSPAADIALPAILATVALACRDHSSSAHPARLIAAESCPTISAKALVSSASASNVPSRDSEVGGYRKSHGASNVIQEISIRAPATAS